MPSAGGDSIQITKHGGFAAFESSDGQYLYYAKGLESDGVWKVAVSGGEEAEVIAFPKAGFWGYWALVDAGIYFVDTESRPQPALKFLNFARTQVEQIAGLEGHRCRSSQGSRCPPTGNGFLHPGGPPQRRHHAGGKLSLNSGFPANFLGQLSAQPKGGIRTPTLLRAPAPQAGASASSATFAREVGAASAAAFPNPCIPCNPWPYVVPCVPCNPWVYFFSGCAGVVGAAGG